MRKPISFGSTNVNLTLGSPAEAEVVSPDSPMRILVLGDFTGRQVSPGAVAFQDRNPIRVDRDNFEEVLQRLGVTLRVPAGDGNEPITIAIREMDDFHPDHLWKELSPFQLWRQLRSELSNPRTFEKAAARVREMVAAPAPSTTPPPAAQLAAAPEEPAATGNLLDQMLGEMQGKPVEPERPRESALQAFIRQIVEPHVVPRIDRAQKAELESIVDRAAAAQMRAILHDRGFQAVEAAWRSLFFLIRRLDTDSSLQLYLLDASKEELTADLLAGEDLSTTVLHELLIENVRDRPWGVLAGLYSFDSSSQDVQVLGRLARLAQGAGAPFLAGAQAKILGTPSLAENANPRTWQAVPEEDEEVWQALRQLPQAAYLGLGIPRWLVRLPYGKNTSTVEGFPFEEYVEGSAHESYLWGNPAVLVSYLLATAYSRQGWAFRPGGHNSIEGLPVHIYKEDGEARARPCAEVLLPEKALDAILNKGLMAFISVRDQDSVRLCGSSPWPAR